MNEESLFAAALEKSGAERRAFLDAACGDDDALRQRVERLLAADERSRGILDQVAPAAAVLAACDTDTPIPDQQLHTAPFVEGTRTGPEADPPGYELAEPVGEGGMGVVYRARDTHLHRDVAVKFLRDRFESDSATAQRFLGEARVTAQLQHPGVPPVHQVGALPDGRPFLVMKLIKGRTLADLLADESPDRGRLIAAFEQVCQAVAFAHSHQIIHRDLKPSNVMVGAFGEVQVMDWGLAKVLGPAAGSGEAMIRDAAADEAVIASGRRAGEGTRTGSVLGTPAYMPPEQAVGAIDRIDARSDVFGLGAILCAILTGQPPYVGADAESNRQLAARAELDDALLRLDGCGADPGLIELCKRCLAPEKSDRPADAGEVARAVADLRAAADERARVAEQDRVRAEAEAREQRKRRRVQLALAAALGLLLAVGGAFGWYFDRQATQRQARLGQNAEAVAALLDQCEDALRAERADRAAIALEAAERRAADGGAEALADRLGRCRADLALLRALDDIDAFRWTWTGGTSGDPGGMSDSSLVAARWEAALAGYGVTSDADAAGLVRGSLIRDRLLTTLDLWLAHGGPAGVREILRSADPDPFREAVRDAVAVRDAARLVELARRPEALAQPPRFAAVLGQISTTPADQRRAVLEEVHRIRQGDLTLLMTLGNTYPINQREGAGERVRWFQAALAAHPGNVAALNNLGIALRDNGQLDRAVAMYREVIRLEPNHAPAQYNLAQALGESGDAAGAIAAYRAAVRADPTFARAHYNLGVSLRDQGDVGGAITSFQAAIRANAQYANPHVNLGAILCDVKRDYDGAVAHFREAIRLAPELAAAHFNLGNALRFKGDLNGAITHYKEAVRLAPGHAPAHANLGMALRANGDPDGAIASFREAIRLDPENAAAHTSLGAILCDVKRDYDGAIASFTETIRLDPKSAPAHSNLGNARWRKGDVPGAVASFTEAVRLDPKSAPAHYNLGMVLRRNRDQDGALAAFRAAVDLDPKDAKAHHMLGIVRWEKGDDVDGVIASFRETVRLNPKFADAHNRLGWLLAVGPDRVRDGKQAIAHATRASELPGGKNPIVYSTLAAAHAEAGDFDRAVEFQKKALSFPDFAKAEGQAGRDRLDLYTRKQPYRDPFFVPRELAPPPREVKL